MSAPGRDIELPAALEEERALLGTVLLCPELIYEVSAKLRPDEFYLSDHERILSAMQGLCERREPIDSLSLLEALKQNVPGPDALRIAAYAAGLSAGVPRRSSLAHHCGIVKGRAILRGIIKLCESASQQALEAGADGKAISAAIQETLLGINTAGTDARLIRDAMQEAVDRLGEYRNDPSDGCIGLTTTLENMDIGTTGIRESEFWIIGARPNVGKTPFGMQIAIAQAKKNIPVLVFSIEMADTQISLRCISHHGIAKPRHVRDPRFVETSVWSNIVQAPEIVKDWPLWLDDTPGLSIKELRHKARYHIARNGIRLIVVDYLGLVESPGRSEYDKVTATAQGLRKLARETKCPILSLCQLNREAKDLTKEPTLADLRSSGEIEQSAHVVGLLHRPPDPQKGSEMLGEKGLIIMAKIREGIGGSQPVRFDKDTLTFKEGWA
jgi:replicative DNA helicase